MHAWPTLGGLIVVLLTAVSGAAADVEKGKTLYTACLVCHTEKSDALGPSLKGVYGRRSAALEDFRYSNPMKRANLTWDEANLRAYIADPQGKVKGNRMLFGGVPSTMMSTTSSPSSRHTNNRPLRLSVVVQPSDVEPQMRTARPCVGRVCNLPLHGGSEALDLELRWT